MLVISIDVTYFLNILFTISGEYVNNANIGGAVPHLCQIAVSLLCTSCLLGLIEVDAQTRDGDVGEV